MWPPRVGSEGGRRRPGPRASGEERRGEKRRGVRGDRGWAGCEHERKEAGRGLSPQTPHSSPHREKHLRGERGGWSEMVLGQEAGEREGENGSTDAIFSSHRSDTPRAWPPPKNSPCSNEFRPWDDRSFDVGVNVIPVCKRGMEAQASGTLAQGHLTRRGWDLNPGRLASQATCQPLSSVACPCGPGGALRLPPFWDEWTLKPHRGAFLLFPEHSPGPCHLQFL